MSRHPEVKWAQRLDKVYVTIQLPDAKDVNVDVQPDGTFTFSGNAGSANNFYELKMTLYGKINKEESKINKGVRSIICVLAKEEHSWWKKLLRGDDKTPHYIRVDWDKWVDEDEDGGDVDMGGMDFSNFGGMEGMEGMEGMGAEGMENDLEESEDEEVEKPQSTETEKPQSTEAEKLKDV